MLYRGIEVTYESIREWGLKFAQSYASQLRRRRPKPAHKWHLPFRGVMQKNPGSVTFEGIK